MPVTKKSARAPAAKKAVAKRTPPAKKVTKTPAAPPATKEATAPAPLPIKQKLIRDSFTIPALEYAGLAQLKARLVKLHRPTKKSELLRAGLAALSGLDDVQLRLAVDRVPSLKTGRPKAAKGAKKKS